MARPILPLLCALPLLAASGSAVWAPAGSPWSEPDTAEDLAGGFMWVDPPTDPAEERVYFHAFLSSTNGVGPDTSTPARFYAYLGLWLDCNGDGYIGMAVPGTDTYSSALLLDTTLCPPGSSRNSGSEVREFLWIGPGSSDIDDPDAAIWSDWGLPSAPTAPLKTSVADRMVYVDGAPGARWVGMQFFPAAPGGSLAAFSTHYATVGGATLAAGGVTPGPVGVYGDVCPVIGPFAPPAGGWSCDPAAWFWPNVVGDLYPLLDVDCHDLHGTFGPC